MRATFSSAFLRGEERAVRFLPADFRDPAARQRAVAQATKRGPISPALLAALTEQERSLPPSAARRANLDALSRPGTAVVVTGQQVGLFLGPLYTFYKAASAIAFARELEAETGARCVPLFWLQTEDHDFEEIRRCYSQAADGVPVELALAPTSSDENESRVSVAHRCLGSEIVGQLDALEEALGSVPGRLPHVAEVMALLRSHYRTGQPLGQAFAEVMATLFADEGLLFLNPRCPAIAKLAAPIYRRSIVEAEQIASVLQARSAALCAVGFDEQVAVRPGTTLVFFHDSVDGPRYRLERSRDRWTTPRTTPHAKNGSPGHGQTQAIADDELLAILDSQPLRFSTSALLRPIVQDTLLPTAAYVGGPGELNYFAQLQPLYELFGVSQPLVVLRARFRCIEENTRALLGKLGLQGCDAELPRAELLRRLIGHAQGGAGMGPDEVRTWLLGDIERRLGELGAAQAGLRDAVQRTRVSVERNIDRLLGRYERILLERDQTLGERVDRLQLALCPEGTPQERHYALPYFAGRYGLQGFKEKVMASLTATSLAAAGVRELEL